MPAKLVQIRRGTTPEHSVFTGKQGEITVDLDKDTIVVHDGNLQGGYPLAKENMSNVIGKIGIQHLNLTSTNETSGQVLTTDGNGNLLFANDSTDVAGTAIGGDLTGTVGNAQIVGDSVGINELNVIDGTAGQALFTDGSGNLSFNNVVTDPTLGGALSGSTSNAVINPNTINGTHISMGSDTSGDLLYYNGTDYVRLPKGTDGDVLKLVSGNPQWGEDLGTGGQVFIEDTFIADGTATTFSPLSQAVASVEGIIVFIDGVSQPTSAYSLPTDTSIQFSSAPENSCNIRILHLGTPVPVGTIADNSVLTDKIANNAVTSDKILDGAVTDAKITSVDASKVTGSLPASQLSGSLPAGMGGGKVLQVVNFVDNQNSSTTSQTFVDTTLQASIQPSSSTSKIAIFLSYYYSSQWYANNTNDPGPVFRLFRDTAQLSHDITVGHDSGDYSADAGHGYSFNFLDSPDTTAMIYYCLKYKAQGTAGPVFYNRGAHLNATQPSGGTAISSIMLVEIGA